MRPSHGLAAAALVATLAGTTRAAADSDEASAPSPAPADPWFGPDKALHFGASFALSGGGYALGTVTLEERWAALLLGGGISLTLGGLKEALDAAGLGKPSARDFAWDVLGTALGLGVSMTFDAALRGPQPR